MAKPILDDATLLQILEVNAKCKTQQEAANVLGIPRNTFVSRLERAKARFPEGRKETSTLEFPVFPSPEISAEEILDHMGRRFDQNWEHQKAINWFKIKVNGDGPIAIVWFGDPHLGNNGCNVPLLRQDVKLVANTPGAYGINLGDTVDNWGGRLTRLYAENDVSRQTERTLARWLLQDSGIRWMAWLDGNHEGMNETLGIYLKSINCSLVPMINWRAKFKLEFDNGRTIRIDAAHDHKGHSIWNDLHGQERAAYMDEDADIYVSGHRHSWGIKYKEMPDGRVVTLARARGYKWIDEFALKNGFAQQQCGASIVTVIDPSAASPAGVVSAFGDVGTGLRYLGSLRP